MTISSRNINDNDTSVRPWRYSVASSLLVTRQSGGEKVTIGNASVFVGDGEIIAANVQHIMERVRNVVACNSIRRGRVPDGSEIEQFIPPNPNG